METLIRLTLSGLILMLLGALLMEAWHSECRTQGTPEMDEDVSTSTLQGH